MYSNERLSIQIYTTRQNLKNVNALTLFSTNLSKHLALKMLDKDSSPSKKLFLEVTTIIYEVSATAPMVQEQALTKLCTLYNKYMKPTKAMSQFILNFRADWCWGQKNNVEKKLPISVSAFFPETLWSLISTLSRPFH